MWVGHLGYRWLHAIVSLDLNSILILFVWILALIEFIYRLIIIHSIVAIKCALNILLISFLDGTFIAVNCWHLKLSHVFVIYLLQHLLLNHSLWAILVLIWSWSSFFGVLPFIAYAALDQLGGYLVIELLVKV